MSIESRIECSICINQIEENNLINAHLDNNKKEHLFHTECLLQWLSINKTCPICRESTCLTLKDRNFNMVSNMGGGAIVGAVVVMVTAIAGGAIGSIIGKIFERIMTGVSIGAAVGTGLAGVFSTGFFGLLALESIGRKVTIFKKASGGGTFAGMMGIAMIQIGNESFWLATMESHFKLVSGIVGIAGTVAVIGAIAMAAFSCSRWHPKNLTKNNPSQIEWHDDRVEYWY